MPFSLEESLRFAYPIAITGFGDDGRLKYRSLQNLNEPLLTQYVSESKAKLGRICVEGEASRRANIRVGDLLAVRATERADRTEIIRALSMNNYDNLGCLIRPGQSLILSGMHTRQSRTDLRMAYTGSFMRGELMIGCDVLLPGTDWSQAREHEHGYLAKANRISRNCSTNVIYAETDGFRFKGNEFFLAELPIEERGKKAYLRNVPLNKGRCQDSFTWLQNVKDIYAAVGTDNISLYHISNGSQARHGHGLDIPEIKRLLSHIHYSSDRKASPAVILCEPNLAIAFEILIKEAGYRPIRTQ